MLHFFYQHVAISVKTAVNIVTYCLLIYYRTTFWDCALSEIIFSPTLQVSASAMLVLLTDKYITVFGIRVVSSGITFIPNLMTVSHLYPMLNGVRHTHTHTHTHPPTQFTFYPVCSFTF